MPTASMPPRQRRKKWRNMMAPICLKELTMTLRFDRLLAWVPMMLAIGFSAPAVAALDVGQKVAPFTAQAALAGKPFTYSLQEALAKGPVVVYFFPAAFSVGCSIEAHAFADAMDQFAALNTSVIGISTDDMETLAKFSSQVCQGKFPVASDESRNITQSFDAVMQTRPEYANRISYVIAPNGTVVTYYQSLNPFKHVEKMLDAVKLIRK
ncbi:peroxiredoxin [Variovorax robiniae]|uniref:thioredoxin-dependent peroxiredoxin n=2 Tax=Variovorax robiniae TaxID=1836199 RepID=A0ABU8XEC0_9BURK